MRSLAQLLFVGFLVVQVPRAQAEPVVVPEHSTLMGPGASQRLLVLIRDKGHYVGDRTPSAKFTSSNPAVVAVDKSGVARAVGDGEATITATVDGETATATVKATGT